MRRTRVRDGVVALLGVPLLREAVEALLEAPPDLVPVLAARVLAAGTDADAAALRDRLADFAEDLRGQAHAKGQRLRDLTRQRRDDRSPGREG